MFKPIRSNGDHLGCLVTFNTEHNFGKGPSKDRNHTIRVHFDGLTTEISVNYVDDPAFDVFFLTLYIVFVQCGILLVNSTPFLDKEFSMHINVKENRSYRYCMSKVYIYLCNHH
jgi:hypothetical protein